MDDDERSMFKPQSRIADLEWGGFFLLLVVAVALGVFVGVTIFYYVILRNAGQ